MYKNIIPVIIGVLLTAFITVMGTATNTLFDVYADTQVIRAEVTNTSARVDRQELRIDRLDQRLNELESGIWPELKMQYKPPQGQRLQPLK